MFGGSTSPPEDKVTASSSPATPSTGDVLKAVAATITPADGEKRDRSSSKSVGRGTNGKQSQQAGEKDKKRRSNSVNKAAALLSSAKNSLQLSSIRDCLRDPRSSQSSLQALSNMDPALAVPQGSLNNSAGESLPTPRSSFRVGVTEDRNKKCRRTMEDTHAYLYHFLGTPLPPQQIGSAGNTAETQVMETDNGYFAIFDGHAGTFAAEWCGKKLHLILEDIMRKNPDAPVPELLDQTFTSVDQQLEKLPVSNSGCTAITAVLRWEDRPGVTPNAENAGGSESVQDKTIPENPSGETSNATHLASPGPAEPTTSRSRVLYTANVGDARIILCRNRKALRLSYDHKGSDENEGRRITNAGGLILNNRVNGVLAVTRALGDSYMKDLVTGHPYTTETVILPEEDEFIILACDGVSCSQPVKATQFIVQSLIPF
jgi:protein phosphatase PTC1